MSPKRPGDRRRQPNRQATRRGGPPRESSVSPEAGTPGLFAAIRRALRSDDPLAIAALASTWLAAGHPALPETGPDGIPRLPLPELVARLADVSVAETTAALHAIAALTADELLAARTRRALAGRHQPMPEQVSGLADLTAGTIVASRRPASTDRFLVLELSGPGIRDAALAVWIEPGPSGTDVVRDTLILWGDIDDVVAELHESLVDAGAPSVTEPVSPADARAQIEAAVAAYDRLAAEAGPEPLEPSDTWPAHRALLAHVARSLPPGGSSTVVVPGSATAPGPVTTDERRKASATRPAGARGRSGEGGSVVDEVMARLGEALAEAGLTSPWINPPPGPAGAGVGAASPASGHDDASRSDAQLRAAENLLTKAAAAYGRGDDDRAEELISRAAALKYDARERLYPIAHGVTMVLYLSITDANEDSESTDDAWVRALFHAVEDVPAGRALAREVLADVAQGLPLPDLERQLVDEFLAATPTASALIDQELTPAELAEVARIGCRLVAAYDRHWNALST